MKRAISIFAVAAAFFLTGEYIYSQSTGKTGFHSAAGLALIWLAVGAILLGVSAVIYRKSEDKI